MISCQISYFFSNRKSDMRTCVLQKVSVLCSSYRVFWHDFARSPQFNSVVLRRGIQASSLLPADCLSDCPSGAILNSFLLSFLYFLYHEIFIENFILDFSFHFSIIWLDRRFQSQNHYIDGDRMPVFCLALMQILVTNLSVCATCA